MSTTIRYGGKDLQGPGELVQVLLEDLKGIEACALGNDMCDVPTQVSVISSGIRKLSSFAVLGQWTVSDAPTRYADLRGARELLLLRVRRIEGEWPAAGGEEEEELLEEIREYSLRLAAEADVVLQRGLAERDGQHTRRARIAVAARAAEIAAEILRGALEHV